MSSYGRRGGRGAKRGDDPVLSNTSQSNLPESDARTKPEVVEDSLQKQQHCVDILSQGFVQSYVDFFYLMHRPDPNPDPNRPELADAEIKVSPSDMQLIKDNLTRAEAARRQGGWGGE